MLQARTYELKFPLTHSVRGMTVSKLAQWEHRVLDEAFREEAVNESALNPGGRSPNALVRDTLYVVTIARCNHLFQLFL